MGKEIKVRYYGEQGAEELYKNIENNRVYVRQPANVPEIVFWLTSNKWQGGYEADCPIKAGITMIVVDKNENELYRETLAEDNWNSGSSASKKAPFLYEAEKEYASEYAKEHDLFSHQKWYDWLLRFKTEFGYDGYDDNWIYCSSCILEHSIVDEKKILGKEYQIVMDKQQHEICSRTWSGLYLIEKGSDIASEICGYKFDL